MGKINKIAQVILSFYSSKLSEQNNGGTGSFNIVELRTVVQIFLADHFHDHAVEPVKNDSVDRILRNLRQKNQVNYVVLNRNASIYQVLPLPQGNS
jgi:hypothetical protein